MEESRFRERQTQTIKGTVYHWHC